MTDVDPVSPRPQEHQVTPPALDHADTFGAIPDERKTLPHWVAWRPELRANGKVDKIPVDPKTAEACERVPAASAAHITL